VSDGIRWRYGTRKKEKGGKLELRTLVSSSGGKWVEELVWVLSVGRESERGLRGGTSQVETRQWLCVTHRGEKLGQNRKRGNRPTQ